MPLITLTTDFGQDSHFVAQVKGHLYNILKDCNIVDISHNISSFDISEAAFLLRNCIHHFPDDTIHAVGVDSNLDIYKSIIVATYRNQWIIAADNGIVPMIFETSDVQFKSIHSTGFDNFSFRNSFPQIIRNLIQSNFNLNDIEGSSVEMYQMNMQKPVLNDRLISFKILHFDAFGNAYTNLDKAFFEEAVGNKPFKIILSRFETVSTIHNGFADVGEGRKVCFFDENGYLVIAINRDRAENLLGLKRESTSQYVVEILENHPSLL